MHVNSKPLSQVGHDSNSDAQQYQRNSCEVSAFILTALVDDISRE